MGSITLDGSSGKMYWKEHVSEKASHLTAIRQGWVDRDKDGDPVIYFLYPHAPGETMTSD